MCYMFTTALKQNGNINKRRKYLCKWNTNKYNPYSYIICALIILYYASQTFPLFYNIVEMFYMTIMNGIKANIKLHR